LQLPAGQLLDESLGEVSDPDPVQGGPRAQAGLGGRVDRARTAIATFSSAVRLGTRP
jgi:hypothetical protein